jgi:RNA polymerase primary sigma factor
LVDWRAALLALLAESPGLTVHDIRARLAQMGTGQLTRRDVNSYLYGHRSWFRHVGPVGSLPRWYLANDAASLSSPVSAPTRVTKSAPSVQDELSLYPWQKRALSAWERAGYRGIIEAVTGAGKTRVAMAAIASHLTVEGKVAVLVHTHELVAQWHKEIARIIPNVIGRQPYVARLGGGSRQSLAHGDILIATAQSAAGWRMAVKDVSGLLIADEVHHYGADAWARGLEEEFDKRLGLTATYEREDLGVSGI